MKTLSAFGLIFWVLFSTSLSRSQEDKTPRVPGVSDTLPATADGVNSPAAKEGVFSVISRTDSIGNVLIGGSKTNTLTVTNTGDATLSITSVRSTNTQFVVSPVSASIKAHAKSSFSIRFTPTIPGAQKSFIVFTHNGRSSPDTVTAFGTGGGTPAFSVNRKMVSYGIVPIATGTRDSVMVTNSGTEPLVIGSIIRTNVRYTVNPAGATIQPGATTTFSITFTPTVNGIEGGGIVFVHNAPTVRDTVAVNGTGTGFTVNRRLVAFGTVAIGGSSRDSVVVRNVGPTSLAITSVTSNNGTIALSPTNASISAGASATFSITFTPTNTSAQTGIIVFRHAAGSSPDTVAVTGTGAGTAGFSLTRRSVSFGAVVVGANKVDSVSVTNTGGVPLVISSVTSSNGTFAVNPANATVQPAQARSFYLTFTPINTIAQSGNIVFTSNASGSPDTVTVSGEGTLPRFALNRKTVPFGSVVVGSNKLDSVTVTNTGGVTLVISSVTSSNGDFTVNPANAILQPAQSRTFYITFTPVSTSAQSGNIEFTHSAASSPDTVSVSGSGTLPGFALNRKSVPFGTVAVGSNRLDSVTVTNSGGITLVISSVTSSNGAFTVNPANAMVQPAQSRTFYLTFTPVSTNAQSGNIVFTHSAASSPDTVTVNGEGTLPGFALNRQSFPFGGVAVGSNTLDSVSVTNTGGVTLVISGVTSSNGAFTVTPANAVLQPAQSRTFYITFTPTSTNVQFGNIVFTHSAAGSPDTVTISGYGMLPGFALSRRTFPFGTVAVGSNMLDSVSVTNTGGVTLVIAGVTSSNGVFTVSPANAILQPAQARTFTISFAPVTTSPQSANIVFTHSAASVPDTLTVSGSGSLPGFALSHTTLPFGFVIIGGSKLDSVSVTNTGGMLLVINSVASSNGVFTVYPMNASLQPDQTRIFYVTFTPVNPNSQSGSILFVHSVTGLTDSVMVSGTGSAPLSPPLLVSPASGSTGLQFPVALSWNAVTGATGYWLEVSTDPSFTTAVISEPTLVSIGRQVTGLAPNTQYYWRVSSRSSIGSGAFTPAWTFTTVASGVVSGTISFSGDLSSTAYRMFGLPGVGSRTAGDILPGVQSVDWKIFRDTGKDTTYPAYYEALNPGAVLRTGEGYWLLQKVDLNISRTDTLPPLALDGTYSIPLHSGWNMISNPFTVSVWRAAVIAANGLPSGTFFWEHVGGTITSSGTTFDPFKGYYFDNDVAHLAALRFPYPFATPVARFAKSPVVDWRIELVFESDISTDRDNYAGIAPGVVPGRNELDQHEPPLAFDKGFLYFMRPEWDALHSRFATDMRAELGTGQTWDFEVWNPRKGAGKIMLRGMEDVPVQNQIVLVNALNSFPVDMRKGSVYSFESSSAKMRFKLIVGTKEFVEGETAKLIPHAYELEQNYPNPFNPNTTITYMIPIGAPVRLEVFSLVGQRVRMLEDGYRPAATYSISWDGKDENKRVVSSGVYFYRIQAGDFVQTRKLVLLK